MDILLVRGMVSLEHILHLISLLFPSVCASQHLVHTTFHNTTTVTEHTHIIIVRSKNNKV